MILIFPGSVVCAQNNERRARRTIKTAKKGTETVLCVHYACPKKLFSSVLVVRMHACTARECFVHILAF